MSRPVGKKDSFQRIRWKYSEILEFKHIYHLYSNKELCKKFNKSLSSIKRIAKDNKLIKIGCFKLYTYDEINLIDICGIYMIFNCINNRLYIGCSENIGKEIMYHVRRLKSNNGFLELQNDWNIGHEFKFAILKECGKDKLHKYEEFYINGLPSEILYNKIKQHIITKCTFNTKFIQNFWAKVDKKSNGCWEWTGRINKRHGYGEIRRLDKIYQIHRVAYYLTYNVDPNGYHVLHSCDNRKCCNPEHLSLGTAADNVRDTISRNRRLRKKSRFSMEDAVEMKRLKESGMTLRAKGEKYNVTNSTIYAILKGKIMLSNGGYCH